MKKWFFPFLTFLFLTSEVCFAQKMQNQVAESFACPPASLPTPSAVSDSLCGCGVATLTASGSSGNYLWYDVPAGGTPNGSGNTFTTPTICSAATYWVEAVDTFSHALAFPNAWDRVDCANTSGNNFALLGDGTIEAWVMDAPGEVLGKDDGPGNNVPKWFFGVYGNAMEFHINGPGMGGGHWIFSSGWSAPSGWHHVAMVKTGNDITFYSNGAPVGGGTLPVPPAPSGSLMSIGWGEECCQASGTIDELRFYGVARSASQIAGSMNTCADPSGLLAYYPMNDMPGQGTIADHSGGGHDGSLVNGPVWVTGYDLYCFPTCFATSARVPVTVVFGSNFTINITPSATELCPGQSATLDAGGGFSNYAWSVSGQNGQTLSINSTGVYSVTVTDAAGCTASDSQDIVSGPPPVATVSPAGATVTCTSPSATLTASGGGTYAWDIGNTVASITVTPASTTTYTVTVTAANGCTDEASATVTVDNAPPVAAISPASASITCTNSSATLTASGGGTYVWSNGATGATITVSPASTTNYTVTVTATNGCTADASATVTVDNAPPTAAISPASATVTCASPSATLAASGGNSYVWSNGSPGAVTTVTPPSSTTYTVTVTAANGCTDIENAIVTVDNAPPTATISPAIATVNCSNPSTTLTASGGETYAWSNSLGSDPSVTINPSSTTTYTVTVTAANGCTDDASATVTVDNAPPVAAISPASASITCTNPSATLTASGGGTFAWSNGSTGDAITVSPASTTTYTVTVTAANGCTDDASATVTVDNAPPNLAPAATASTCGLPNGAADANASGGASPFTYTWSNGASTPGISNVLAGNYSVTVTGANGCTATASATVPNNSFAITFSWTNTPNTSCSPGNGNGTLNIFPNPAVPPAGLTYSFEWSTGETTQNLTGLSSGNYSVTISAGGSCTMTGGVAVGNATSDPVLSQVVTPAVCGQSNGGIDLEVSGATLPYSFLWSNGETTEDLTNILAGNYEVTVTGANDCADSTLINVPNNSTNFSLSGIATPVTSCAISNGAIDFSVSPPGGAYDFAWSNGETTEDIANLADGIYTVTVTEAGNCSASASFEVGVVTTFPVLSQTTSAANCGLPNGSVNLSVTGGEAPYEFFWSNGETTEDLTNVLSGNYSVTVTGSNDCTATISATVPENTTVFSLSAITLPNTSCIVANGSINLSATPAGAYTFSWSNGSTQEDLTGLAAGTYTVTVSPSGAGGGGSCTTSASYTVAENAIPPLLASSANPAACGGSNGGVDLTVTPTVGNIFAWSNGFTGEDLANVPSGGYSVTVTGANGCTDAASVTVPENTIAFSLSATAAANTSCLAPNGSIDLSVSPASPPFGFSYAYFWTNAAGFTGTTQDLAGIHGGEYSVTVSMGGDPAAGTGCLQTGEFSVSENALTPVLSQNVTAAICGQANGAIDLSVSGGAAPYTFLWSDSAETEDLFVILPGTYEVTVTGANGCQSSAIMNVPNNSSSFSLAAAVMPNQLCGAAGNGAINLTVSPSAPGTYTFLWSTGATSDDLANLAPGAYSVTVTEGGSCSAFATYQVENESAVPVFSQTIQAATCGQATGGIDLTTSAVGANSFLWSTGDTTEDLANVLPGSYSVTVTGSDGCTATATATVPNEQLSVSLSADILPNTFCVGGNGSLALSASPAGSYGYFWSTSATVPNLFNLAAGSYSVTVSIAGNCTSTASFNLPDSLLLPVLSQNISPATCGQSNGSIDLSVSGAASPFSFQWTNPNGSLVATTEDLSGIAPGNYLVSVTDANGCTATATAAVSDNPILFSLDTSTVANTSCSAGNGGIDLTVSPAGSYSFLWSNDQTSEDLSNLIGGSYSVTVSAGGTCVNMGAFTIGNDIPAPSAAGSVAGDLCGEKTGSIDLAVSGGETPYSFLWSNGDTSQNPGSLAAGSYFVTVAGANGCAAVYAFNVPAETLSIVISGSPTANTSCVGGNGAISLTLTPAAPPTNSNYQFLWSNGLTSQDLGNLAAGNYSVMVSAGICAASANFQVASVPALPVIDEIITPAACGVSNGSIDLTVSNAVQPLQFAWSNQEETEDLDSLQAGNYIVTVTDAVGCSDTASINVPSAGVTPSVNGTVTPNSVCAGSNGTINLTIVPQGNYTYNWTGGFSSPNLGGLAGGTYEVTVSAGGNCETTASFDVPVVQVFPEIVASVTPVFCGNGAGEIDVTVIDGLPPFQFKWSDGDLVEDQVNAAPGSYTVTVTGWNACTSSASFMISDSLISITLIGSTTPNISCVLPNGSVDLGIQPPGNFSILWSNEAVTEDLAGVPPGNYQVTVSQGVTCAASASFTVADGVVLPSASATPTPATCGENNGSIQLLATGGTPPFTFLWSNGATTQDLFVIPPESYYATVTDANGCTATASAQVVLATSLTVSISQTANYGGFGVSCPGASDGSLEAQWAGGQAPFWVLWSNGSTTSSIENLQPGSYMLTLTDAAGCSATAEISLTAPPPFSFLATAQAPACPGERGGIGVSVQGATGPFLFSLDGAPFQQVDFFENVEPGEHFLLAQDANGCEQEAQAEISEAEPLSLILLAGGDTVIALGNSLELSWQANFQPDSLAWFASQDSICSSCQNPVVQPEKMQTYRLTAFAGGCFAEAELHVFVKKERKVFFPTVFSPNGDGVNDFFNVFTGQEVRHVNSLLLFDRWGELVFSQMPPTPNDPASGWDGTFNGQALAPAVFVFFCEVEFVDGRTEILEGGVTLVR